MKTYGYWTVAPAIQYGSQFEKPADPKSQEVRREEPEDVIRDAISRARQANDYVAMGELAVKLATYPVKA